MALHPGAELVSRGRRPRFAFRHALPVALLLIATLSAAASAAPRALFTRSSIGLESTAIGPRSTPVRVDAAAIRSLRDAGGGTVVLPLENGRSLTVTLTRDELFAPGAVRTVTGDQGPRPLVIDATVLRGDLAGEPGWVVLTLSRDGAFGMIDTPGGRYVIAPARAARAGDADGIAPHVIGAESDLKAHPTPFVCATEERFGRPPVRVTPEQRAAPPTATTTARLWCDVAIDCDYEFFANKMSGNLGQATTYMLSLAAAGTAIYEHDLNTSLRISYLNFWTTASDPYNQGTTAAQLAEFVQYWQANRTDVSRHVAFLASGRSLGGGIAQGIGVLCDRNNAYAVAQLDGIYHYPTTTTTWDAVVYTHELGHDFGSPHTHSCYWGDAGYTTPGALLDTCYTAEGACYGGPTGYLPPNRGTIMSYCHLLGPINNTVRLEFHDACKIVMRQIAEQCLPDGAFDPQLQIAVGTAGYDVDLSWNASPVSGVTRYDVYRGTASLQLAPTLIGSTTGTTFDDPGRIGTNYYRVRAVRASDQSAYSLEATATVCGEVGPTFYSANAATLSPVAIDLNHDNVLDLVVANNNTNKVSVMLGLGGGALGAPVTFTVGANPAAIAAGDWNEDGNVDLAVANSSTSGSISVLIGAGNGTFAAPVNYTAAQNTAAIVTGDWNEDGIADLAVANRGNGLVSVTLGQGAAGVGNGTFGPRVTYNVGLRPTGLLTGDFNDDGITDLATTNNTGGSVSILLGHGASGVGDGTFNPAVDYLAGAGAVTAVAGDFDEDGITDLAVALNVTSGAVSILRGLGSGGVGNGTFAAPVTYPAGNSPAAIAAADLSDDGIVDLVVANALSPGVVGILLGQGAAGVGNGGFDAAVPFAAGANPSGLAIADFDLDGAADIAVAHTSAPKNAGLLFAGCVGSLSHAVQVVSPNGGEAWVQGTEQTIAWTRGAGVTAVNVEVSRDDGAHWERVASNETGTQLAWTVTSPSTAAATCRVRVLDAALPAHADASDRVFWITPSPPVDVPLAGAATLALSAIVPNPADRELWVAFTLPTPAPARIELLDVSGRRVKVRDVSGLSPGPHRVNLAEGAPVPSGLYVVRLAQSGATVTRKAIVTR
jgi:hypothetical protein